MEYNELDSPYISPFLDSRSKNNKELVDSIKQHVNQQSPLPPEKAFLEGKVVPYSIMNRKFSGRR